MHAVLEHISVNAMHVLHTVVDCRDLNSPTNGQVSLDGGTVFNATATYTCDSTSELTPPDGGTRTCQANGEWTGTAAICKCKSGFKEGDASGVCGKLRQ